MGALTSFHDSRLGTCQLEERETRRIQQTILGSETMTDLNGVEIEISLLHRQQLILYSLS